MIIRVWGMKGLFTSFHTERQLLLLISLDDTSASDIGNYVDHHWWTFLFDYLTPLHPYQYTTLPLHTPTSTQAYQYKNIPKYNPTITQPYKNTTLLVHNLTSPQPYLYTTLPLHNWQVLGSTIKMSTGLRHVTSDAELAGSLTMIIKFRNRCRKEILLS